MFLQSIALSDVFHQEIPKLPMGKYAHIIVLRETSSFALFQTDGELNLSRVSLGRQTPNQKATARIVLFKRKQSTPERLTGRELLRRYGLVENCKYNTAEFCKRCPDCIYYGFAIGDQGSERSKVLVDSAFSVTGYDGRVGLHELLRADDAVKHLIQTRATVTAIKAAAVAAGMRTLKQNGIEKIRFAWCGGTKTGEPHYWRLHGPHFVIEYDNTQNGANHIHSVWRDVEGDWGDDLLADHYAKSH